MPTTLEKPRELKEDTQEAKRRGPTLTGGMLALIIALVLGIPAIFITLIVLIEDDDHMSNPAPTMMGGGGAMMGGDAVGQPSAAGTRTVMVTLGEMYVRPSTSTVRAGKVTFIARNVGTAEHELMVERMPIKLDKPGQPNEEAAIGMIEEMGHMGTGRMTLRLKPGKYELFCNVPGHYAAGQTTVLTVAE